jgi:head-tail adaptor
MIGGNIDAILQQKVGSTTNAIGERIHVWSDVQTLRGWLDLSSGDSKYTHDAKLQESTHIFMCDHIDIDRFADDKRLVVNGLIYDVLLIDDPMELHQHLEIYLKYVGR